MATKTPTAFRIPVAIIFDVIISFYLRIKVKKKLANNSEFLNFYKRNLYYG